MLWPFLDWCSLDMCIIIIIISCAHWITASSVPSVLPWGNGNCAHKCGSCRSCCNCLDSRFMALDFVGFRGITIRLFNCRRSASCCPRGGASCALCTPPTAPPAGCSTTWRPAARSSPTPMMSPRCARMASWVSMLSQVVWLASVVAMPSLRVCDWQPWW